MQESRAFLFNLMDIFEVNMREKYESLPLSQLKELAKARGMKGISALKKSEVIERMLQLDESEREAKTSQGTEPVQEEKTGKDPETVQEENPPHNRRTVQTDLSEENERIRNAARQMRNGRMNGRDNADARSSRTAGRETADARGSRTAGRETADARSGRTNGRENTDARNTRTNGRENAGVRNIRTNGRENLDARNVRPAGQDGNEVRTVKTGETENREPEVRSEVRSEVRPEVHSEVRSDRPPAELGQLDSGLTAHGILEVMADGFGFIRSDNFLSGENDVYVSPSQIRRFNLKTGDVISGNMRIKTAQEKFSALLYLKTINGFTPSEAAGRYNFEDMTPIFPNERLRMERASGTVAMRIVDLISPIGKGQRGMIVSPPKAGKTTLLKDVARSILANDPEMQLIILLIDERPEEVTDIKEAIQGENVEVIYSTFDETPDHHRRVSEMVIERAKRLVEHKKDVTILLDSITRLARAYNLTVPPSGRTLSGGLDPAALHMPKRFFGAARNMREGGSLTILATALVDTGSKMDDVVYEEFKGTGNMELVLDRKLSERRVFPAIDIQKSGTRREDLLLDREEQEAVYIMRRALNGMKSEDAVENILNKFVHTKSNRELVQLIRRQRSV